MKIGQSIPLLVFVVTLISPTGSSAQPLTIDDFTTAQGPEAASFGEQLVPGVLGGVRSINSIGSSTATVDGAGRFTCVALASALSYCSIGYDGVNDGFDSQANGVIGDLTDGGTKDRLAFFVEVVTGPCEFAVQACTAATTCESFPVGGGVEVTSSGLVEVPFASFSQGNGPLNFTQVTRLTVELFDQNAAFTCNVVADLATTPVELLEFGVD